MDSIVAALSELSALYVKAGNPQAGNTYRKVNRALPHVYITIAHFVTLQAAAVVRQYPAVVTSGRALSKGKTKVDGIGAKCGEIIDEFLATGEVSKIAEKRAEVGSA